jgi:hypothetical protein
VLISAQFVVLRLLAAATHAVLDLATLGEVGSETGEKCVF